MREIADEHYVEPVRPAIIEKEATIEEDGETKSIKVSYLDPDVEDVPRGAWAAPRHIGMRRYVEVEKSDDDA
jgi:hypothetical protein